MKYTDGLKPDRVVTALLIFMAFPMANLLAQSEANTNEVEQKNSISIAMGHAFIDQGIEQGGNTWLYEPSIMLDYNYKINNRWFVGVHSDVILQSFEVIRSSDQSVLERSYPISLVAIGGFKINEFLGIMLGGGIELEKDEHLGVFRFGMESGFRLSKHWEVPLSFTYDIKFNGYSSFALGLGFARSF